MSSPGHRKGKNKRKSKGRGGRGRGRENDAQLSTPGRSEAAENLHLDETEDFNEGHQVDESASFCVPEEKALSFEQAEEKPAATTSRSASKAKPSASCKADEKRQESSAISKTKTPSTSEDNPVVSCPAAPKTKQTATSASKEEQEAPEQSHLTASKAKAPSTGNSKQQPPVTEGILKTL